MVEQVGGNHYEADYQHWDWAPETGLPYLEGCATKYLDRWRKKDGKIGLEKAISYLEKIAAHGVTVCPPAGERKMYSSWKREKYLESRSIPEQDAAIIRLIDMWTTHADIHSAIVLIRNLIDASDA